VFDVMEQLTDDLLYHGDLNSALRRMMQQGFDVLMPSMHLDHLPEGVLAEPFGEIELRGFPGAVSVVRLTGAPTTVTRHDTGELWTRSPFG
jgi:class 3 adenylate cyclase